MSRQFLWGTITVWTGAAHTTSFGYALRVTPAMVVMEVGPEEPEY